MSWEMTRDCWMLLSTKGVIDDTDWLLESMDTGLTQRVATHYQPKAKASITNI